MSYLYSTVNSLNNIYDDMKGYIENIENLSLENNNFRKVLYTTTNSQLVVMSLKPGEEVGEEVHHLDQFIRFEGGVGEAVLDGASHNVSDGIVVLVPSGTRHNIINSSKEESLKLYTLYSPPNHRDGTIHKTKEDAERDNEDHFDGNITA